MAKGGSPHITKTLLDWLEERFPNRVPDIDWTDRQVWAAVGQQQVLDLLRSEHRRQRPTETLVGRRV